MIVFSNSSLIPMEAVTTIGVSVKETDNAIGQFGTGIKYAIAGVLRLGGTITIYRDGTPHTFTTSAKEIRGQTFQVVLMNGTPLGFTTDLGKHWAPWMVVRELYSNCLDEGGTHGTERTNAPTEIVVTGAAFEAAYRDRDEWLVSPRTLLWAGPDLEIHEARADNKVFYQGISIGVLPWPSIFTYNFLKDVPLTEDRTFRSAWDLSPRAPMGLSPMARLDLFEQIAFAREGTFEANFNFLYGEFTENVQGWLQAQHHSPGRPLTGSLRERCERLFGPLEVRTRPATPLDLQKIKRAQEFLTALDLPIYEVHIPADDYAGHYGFVSQDKIFITRRCLDEGVAQTAMTLVEETLHKAFDLEDFTREFQDRLLRLLLTQYENHTGAPL